MQHRSIKTVGILGAGKLGIVLAQLSIRAGYTVYISGSSNPDKIALSVDVLAPGAHATTSENVIQKAELIILALPLGKYHTIPKHNLHNKLIIDAMNYWWEVDGIRNDLNDLTTSSSEIVRDFLQTPHLVKALNHMGYHNLHDEPRPSGSNSRKAIAVAGDVETDVHIVATFIDSIGFDPVVAGQLSEGIRMQAGSEVFGANVDKRRLQAMLDYFHASPFGKEVAKARSNTL